MTTTSLRTVTVQRPPYRTVHRCQIAQPGDDLGFSLDVTVPLSDVDDSVASASVAIRPGGTSELQELDLTVSGSVLTVLLLGGVARRGYEVQASFTRISGQTEKYLIGLLVNPALACWSPVAVASYEFGTPITCTGVQ
jgi:hypothetical protein